MKLPRFTLRELFLLVVIAASGCAWWLQWRRANEAVTTLKAAREENEVLQYVSAIERDEATKNQQALALAKSKLEELGCHARFMVGHKEDGATYVFLAED